MKYNWCLISLFEFICLIVLIGAASELGRQCTTPNGENGTCIQMINCKTLKTAYKTGIDEERQFVMQSICGYDEKGKVLTCCGTYTLKVPNSGDLSSRGTLNVTATTTTPSTTVDTTSPSTERTFPKPSNRWHDDGALPSLYDCGKSITSPRLFNGEKTELQEFPWMALIWFKNEGNESESGFKCAGSVINRRYILTAAHCLRTDKGLTPKHVILGEHDYTIPNECLKEYDYNDDCEEVVTIDIETTIMHPFFSTRTFENDIGLIRLKERIAYNEWVGPICLPAQEDEKVIPNGTRMTVSGWGLTENGTSSPEKLQLKLPIVRNEICRNMYKNDRITKIKSIHICAGGEPGKDACQGDSGGPLMSWEKNGLRWFLEGIVSLGHVCGEKNIPGIYTRVGRFLNWIKQTITNKN